MAFEIRGLSIVEKNLNRELDRIIRRTPEGLFAAALFIEGESNEIVPQDKGVLINSSFVRPGMVGVKQVVTVGYTAKYAAAVHEMPDTNNFSKPGTGPKFLQKAVFSNTGKIVRIIRSRVKL